MPDLIGGCFEGVFLPSVNLSGTLLMGADLRQTNLTDATFLGADLFGAELNDAILHRTNLSGTSLRRCGFRRADLMGADLLNADLSEADLYKANFSGTRLGWTTFGSVDLSEARSLARAVHVGPSTIGIDTLHLSHGQISEEFLRGAGVPELFVRLLGEIDKGSPTLYYSCFISYSSHDEVFAERLHADLRAKNLRCWFAPEDLKIGEHFPRRIEESIRLFDKVMIVLSQASVESRWVEREVNAAREREDRENGTVLFPIRIDDAVMNTAQPWAAELRRSRHIGDFRQWTAHVSYVKAFDRLLRDLKVERESRPA